MSDYNTLPLSVRPVISYPHQAEVGKTYLMTVDLQPSDDNGEWSYEEEEYTIYCMVDSKPLFKCERVLESAIVLHRFGGSYGAAKFWLKATDREMEGKIKISLVNSWGVPVKNISLKSLVKTEARTNKNIDYYSENYNRIDYSGSRILHINLEARGEKEAEFRFFWNKPNEDERQTLLLDDIAELNERADTAYYRKTPVDYVQTGQKLFNWLDGRDRLFNRALEQCPDGEQLILAISATGRLANLPWELLHDGSKFLIEQHIVPVHWVKVKNECLQIRDEPKNRFLNVLFMATSPQGVEPQLDFEAEEERILEATQKMRSLSLTVEESGNLQELGDLVEEYDRDYFDLFHLTGHANIENGKPYFLTETEYGDRAYSSAAEIARSLERSHPRVIFLSGSPTGYSENAVPLMAEALLQEGATAVLSWDDRVRDESASVAAAKFYQELSMGQTITEALAETYQRLQGRILAGKSVTGWHPLRFYVADTLPGALVTVPRTRGRKPAPAPTVADRFIDEQKRLRLIPRTEFVGRRRQLQNCLRVLKTDAEKIGVLLYGMGGVGKSAIAARLCHRLSDFQTLVWWRQVDEGNFTNTLAEKLAREQRQTRRGFSEDLKFRLRDIFADIELKPFLFVFDDFEWNLEPQGDGFILQTNAVQVLESLLWAIQETGSHHRLIITCRYRFDWDLSRLFFQQGVDKFNHSDLLKKLRRLENFNSDRIDESLIERALMLADGNTRLLEWLDKQVLSQENAAELLTEYETRSDEWQGKIIWNQEHQPQLQIDEPLEKILSLCLVYEVPVPMAALEVVCQGLPQYKQQLQRAIDLGLMASSSEVEEGEQTYRVSRILPRIIPRIQLPLEPDIYTLYRQGWEKLSELWGKRENENEEQWREIFRLKLADKTNPQRFREGFEQMLSVQFQPYHQESDSAFEAKLREKKDQLDRSAICENLEALLQQNKWREADRETAWIFYQIMVREEFNDLYNLYKKFPVIELNEIDTLWVKYSKGGFGFSVLEKIYQSLGIRNIDYDTWKKFGEQVKWYDEKKERWREVEDIYQEVEAELRSQTSFPRLPMMWLKRLTRSVPSPLVQGSSVSKEGGWGRGDRLHWSYKDTLPVNVIAKCKFLI